MATHGWLNLTNPCWMSDPLSELTWRRKMSTPLSRTASSLIRDVGSDAVAWPSKVNGMAQPCTSANVARRGGKRSVAIMVHCLSSRSTP